VTHSFFPLGPEGQRGRISWIIEASEISGVRNCQKGAEMNLSGAEDGESTLVPPKGDLLSLCSRATPPQAVLSG